MLRFVAVRRDEGLTLVLDERRTLPGRGAWVHPDLACFDLAVRRKAFGRALRVTATLDVVEARGAMERALP